MSFSARTLFRFCSVSMCRPNEPPPAYDAVSEDWFDDPAAMGAALASPEGQAVAADVPNYLDPSRFAFLVVEEEDVALPTGSAASSAG